MEIRKFTLYKLRTMNLNWNLNWPKILPLLLLNILLIAPASAQSMFDLSFQGKLADIQGKEISNEHFDLAVQICRESAYEVLYEIKTSTSSDEGGWFGFIIPNMSQFLMEEGELKHPVEIRLEILPNAETKWMREGEDFMLSYTLKPYADSADYQLMMTRMEGSKLIMYSENHLYAFKDQDPFAYLLGGFLITNQPAFSDSMLLELKQWLSPLPGDEQGGASRGVKGGFPSGGYYKKK